MKRWPAWVVAGLALGAVAGCTPGDPAPEPGRPTPSQEPAPSPTATQDELPDGSVEVTTDLQGTTVSWAVHPVQVADGQALVTVDYRLADPSDDADLLLMPFLSAGGGSEHPGAAFVRVVDLDAGVVLMPGEDADGTRASTRDVATISGDQQHTTHTFVAPPTSSTVDVLLPFLGMALDVPVETVTAEDLAATPSDVGAEGRLAFETHALSTHAVAYDLSSTTQVEEETVTVSLASDVLFATDESALTPEATARVQAAADEIADVAAEGRVQVVGHTDDRASDDYNMRLSQARAESVASVLTARLGAGFDVVSEGRGETEPAVPGTTEEARAANRRVEILFEADRTGVVEVAPQVEVPEATGPVAAGPGPVRVTGDTGTEYDVAVRDVLRHRGHLVATLEVTQSSAQDAVFTGVLGTGGRESLAGRALAQGESILGAHGVSVLGSSSRLFPLMYRAGDVDVIVGDRSFGGLFRQGDVITATVVLPDPGGDTVDLDVDGIFRLDDVPVD